MNEELAVPRPVIAPSDAEREAVELMSRISTEGCGEKAAKLKENATLSLPTEPTPVPEFVTRKVQADRERIEAEIATLRERRQP